MRNPVKTTTVVVEQSQQDYKICISYKCVRFAEMYKDSETPSNSIKLHIYQPNELIYIIEYQYSNDYLSEWQHHIYPIGAKGEQKTYDGNSITQLFDYAFSE